MPRVTNPPRVTHASAATPHKSPFKIPLNDDQREKAARLQSRHALHDLQMNTLKAAASPVRKKAFYDNAPGSSPATPRSHLAKGKENIDDGGLAIIAAPAATPAKRVPILANFEEWMKMATDNKINATNSWNFALIDYFHDMSLLREGDSVNFQKASCTLDGCVKIYTSRVDSVATETGKLLSGLADSVNKKATHDGDADQDGPDGEEDEEQDGGKKKSRKRAQRSSEATLVASFATLQLKKMELEFAVDPLFKKASADFDEGGAKGLLLNHLSIDSTGRIVFDSSDDTDDGLWNASAHSDPGTGLDGENNLEQSVDAKKQTATSDIDIETLKTKFFPNLDILEDLHVCPSLQTFDLGTATGFPDGALPKVLQGWQTTKDERPQLGDETGIVLEGDDVAGFDDDDMFGALENDAEFGHGGEAWAKTAALNENQQLPSLDDVENPQGGEAVAGITTGPFDPEQASFHAKLQIGKLHNGQDNLLTHFDTALRQNWAGPENWKIQRMKKKATSNQVAKPRRKEKEPFTVDFLAPLDKSSADLIYTQAPSSASISLPRTQWKSKTRNLLPDDKHFNSRQLLRLFLKPKAHMRSHRQEWGRTKGSCPDEIPRNVTDEAFWAQRQTDNLDPAPLEMAARGDYDANFFQDDGGFPDPQLDDEEFADAKEAMSPHELGGGGNDVPSQQGPGDAPGAFGSQLVTQNRRTRPEYVQYARVAKKVDVRRLKEEMWRGISSQKPVQEDLARENTSAGEDPLRFTSVMNDLQQVYPKQAMDDISTSYCFICLLHLANEKGLTINNETGLEELKIQRESGSEVMEVEA